MSRLAAYQISSNDRCLRKFHDDVRYGQTHFCLECCHGQPKDASAYPHMHLGFKLLPGQKMRVVKHRAPDCN